MTETGSISARLNALMADPWFASHRQTKEQKPLMVDIARVTADFYGETFDRLRRSSSKCRAGAYPRQIAYFLCRMLTNYTYPQIGKYFHRDHTTILHGVRSISQRMLREDVVAREIEILKDRIEGERQTRESGADQ